MTQECLQLPGCHDGGSLMSSLCPGYQLWMLGELVTRMVQFVHGFHYLYPLVVPSHIDSGFRLVTCFGQWDNSICDISTGLKSACAFGLVFLVLLESCHQAQANLLEDEIPREGKLTVSQYPVSLAAHFSYMCESQPRLTKVTLINRTS